MLRSMYSGISGMKNFQTKLDVIGNNIANVNTYGFKKGRVTFKDTMNQMISGATAATENRGGKNPTQVGLGSTLATIDTIHTGSSLQTTGRSLDLGIDGDGYFVVRQGNSEMYTRAGNFYLDDNGTLVNSDGLNVQAFKFDDAGNITTDYGDIVINVNAVLPGIETTGIKLSENLSANATNRSVFSQQIKVVDSQGEKQDATIYFKKLNDDKWGVFANQVPYPSEVSTTGNIKITNPETYTGLTDTSWKLTYEYDATSTPNIKYFLDVDGNPANKIEMKINPTTKKLQAVDSTRRAELQGLEIDLSSVQKPANAVIDSNPLNSSLKINVVDATSYTANADLEWSVEYVDTSTDPNFTNPGYYLRDSTGGIIQVAGKTNGLIAGNGDMEFVISGSETLKLNISGWQNISTPGATASVEELEKYNDYISYTATININAKTPDEPNGTNPMVDVGEINITAATQPNKVLEFSNGRLLNSSMNEELSFKIATGLKDDVDTVADESLQTVFLNFDFSELTQLDGTTTAVVDPNGNLEGKLESFNIGSLGEINGVYSNGEIVTLGQLALAKFSNTSGLTKAGNNLFQQSINSGNPDINVAGEGRGTLSSGSLEMSNVDLSEEFTEMITAQRGFQANTRIITTSDEILQELVNLKR